MILPVSYVLIPLLLAGLNWTPEQVIMANAQSEYLLPQYYCADFASDLATELNIIGVEAYSVYGHFRGGGHYWTVAKFYEKQIKATKLGFANYSFSVSNYSWVEIEPQTGEDVSHNPNYQVYSVRANYTKRKEVMGALLP